MALGERHEQLEHYPLLLQGLQTGEGEHALGQTVPHEGTDEEGGSVGVPPQREGEDVRDRVELLLEGGEVLLALGQVQVGVVFDQHLHHNRPLRVSGPDHFEETRGAQTLERLLHLLQLGDVVLHREDEGGQDGGREVPHSIL